MPCKKVTKDLENFRDLKNNLLTYFSAALRAEVEGWCSGKQETGEMRRENCCACKKTNLGDKRKRARKNGWLEGLVWKVSAGT